MRIKISAVISAVVGLLLVVGSESSFGQYARFTTRPVATSACASGACPTAPVQASSAASSQKTTNAQANKIDAPKQAPGGETTGETDKAKEETKIVEPIQAEPGVTTEKSDDSVPNAAPVFPDAQDALGEVTLIYPSDAQSEDEVIAFAARRAREPVDEDDDPIDSETPIGSVRAVGARLKELTAAVEAQRKDFEAFASKEGDRGAILDAIKKQRENDETFQKEARDGLRTLLDAVKKQNETILTQGRERIKETVLPERPIYSKWGLWVVVGFTFAVVWIILIWKVVAWLFRLGGRAIERGLQAAVAGVKTSATVLTTRSETNDEIKL